ncbi:MULTISPECIES: sporulation integral membrane protein YtvI [unclassified Bacillus (in: firmicutes)]|uniref:sporulation integral membrane protein YtvI n=1 Tax=unclassified Bacillus (in: firmicutes) TaxID=185979 RepID=UPI0008E92CC8|nr:MULTISPECIES: sporulation integral membrane protein YtvI [unclassified Bacillus (in: firmicutes)]SFB17317.1 sporulation integral membrane protein YtvI [Bacillus sp. UNCCL13]SFQ77287.1 sporulation integral membrane protein YtvI [Bacillus sp. cl95]
MNKIYLYRSVRFILVLAIILIALWSFLHISRLTYPFLIGLGIAYMMNPLVNFFEKKARMPRSLAVFTGIIIIFAVFAGLITLLIAEIVSGANYLANVVPKHLDTVINYIENLFAAQIIPLYNQLTSLFNTLEVGQQDTIMENIQNVGTSIATTVGDFIQNFFGNIPVILSWFPSAATVLIFSLLATFFISKDWFKLTAIGDKLLPERAKYSTKTVFADLKKALFGFLKAQLTLISITTVIILIGLLILRVDYAITIALVSGIVDIIPYLGTGAVFIPWIIYEAIAGDMSLAIGLGVLYVVVLVQRQIMEPKILSSSIGLDPLATLIALFVGFKLIGFLGLIVGPVVLVIITTLNKANVFRDLWAFIKGKEA